MQPIAAEKDLYHGLRKAEATLPTSAYLDAGEYQRDLEAIWYRRWVMVCRAADIAEPLAYKVFTIGTQEVLVVRDETGVLRAFHNTCRHRGSQLCQAESGPAEGAAAHLPLPFVVLFASRRPRSCTVEDAAGRVPERRTIRSIRSRYRNGEASSS